VSDESLRLAHAGACDREGQSKVAPEYVPASLPAHEDELRVAHEGRPTLAEQWKQEWKVYP
jgi:hypothetical protein